MSRDLPKAYEPAAIEDRWAQFWVAEKLFDVPTPSGTQAAVTKFTQLLPPPNVTGRLHMGHMLNQTEMDILARWHRMRGELSLWVPGTDHAGIATQLMVERQLLGEGTSREAVGRKVFTDRVWQWKTTYGNAILDQMKRLGASVDWSREYFTMDDRLSVAVREAFVRLYEQGLIYRGERIVNWDPDQRTAVSDLEVNHEDRLGKLYSIRYQLLDGPLPDGTSSITIATTRPETLLGDTAVVVNPADERYTKLIGKFVTLPFTNRQIPILADDWARPEFGTGAVKVTPAHDPNDFAIGERHGLPNITIMDETAHIDLPGSPYHGLDRFAAREQIVKDLEAAGLLVDVKDHTLAIATSQRSGVIIEPRLSKQWFLKIQPLADKAIAAVDEGHIRFTPENYKRTWDEWMGNIHDWCISRQLWWGHRIPAWFCDACDKLIVTRDTQPACPGCGITDIRQETDVLDTWFSSGLLPFSVFGWPSENPSGDPAADAANPDLQAFYPTQLLVTGSDIIFFWVARMIMFGTHFMLDVPMPDGSPRTLADAVPFREVYFHALVRDADRQKMSKTKGNVIDPIEIVTRFGTDAVRFTLASMASPGTDIAFSEARTEGNRAFANKIWNAARFLFLQLDRAEAAGYNVSLSTQTLTSQPEAQPQTLTSPTEAPPPTLSPRPLAQPQTLSSRPEAQPEWRDPLLSTPPQDAALPIEAQPQTPSSRPEALPEWRDPLLSTPPQDAALLTEAPPQTLSSRPEALPEWRDPLLSTPPQDGAVPTEAQRSGETALPPASRAIPLESRWILSRLSAVCAEVDRALTAYRFDEAANAVYQFFWGELCDWYLELVKLRLNFGEPASGDAAATTPPHVPNDITAASLATLTTVFETSLRLLSPFMPFLTEEIWHALYTNVTPAKSIALTRFPQPADLPSDPVAEAAITTLQELIVTVRGIRKELGIPEKEAAPIQIHASNRILALADANADMLARMARVAAVEFADAPLSGANARSTAAFDVAVVYERQIDVPAERERLTKDLAKFDKGLAAADRQLGNEGFIARAPAHIVDGLRRQSAETRSLRDKARAALDALPPA